jgi:chromosome segregation ATPase
VKPSPFYLLDEVDAALDDANVERFSAMVREVGSSDAQLLIVTHNKKTMELASRMYGVTMRRARHLARDRRRPDPGEPERADAPKLAAPRRRCRDERR